MYGVILYPFSGSSIIKVLLLITFLVSLKVDFNQAFLTPADNLTTSEKSLCPGMKCDNPDHDSPKLGNK